MNSYVDKTNNILDLFDEGFLAVVEEQYDYPFPREEWGDLSVKQKLELIAFLTDMLQQFWLSAVLYIEANTTLQ